MVRPQRCRNISSLPNCDYFKPRGIPLRDLDEVILTLDEYEAIKLKDLDGIEQNAAASKMEISQPTFFRLISGARKKIADALVNGKAIRIEGGIIKINQNN